jgi:hypothetical protein
MKYRYTQKITTRSDAEQGDTDCARVAETPLVVGLTQLPGPPFSAIFELGCFALPNRRYTRTGRGDSPRGASRFSRRSTSLPGGQRERPHAKESRNLSRQVLVAEGAGHDPARALSDTADFKSATFPIRGGPPLSKSRCGSKASAQLVPTRLERASSGFESGRSFPVELRGHWVVAPIIALEFEKSTDG